jgi:hypothetical protein
MSPLRASVLLIIIHVHPIHLFVQLVVVIRFGRLVVVDRERSDSSRWLDKVLKKIGNGGFYPKKKNISELSWLCTGRGWDGNVVGTHSVLHRSSAVGGQKVSGIRYHVTFALPKRRVSTRIVFREG